MAGRALSSVPTPKVHGLCGDKGRGHLRPLEGRNGNKRRWLTDSATGAAPALVSQHLHVCVEEDKLEEDDGGRATAGQTVNVPTPKVHGLCGDKGRGHLQPLWKGGMATNGIDSLTVRLRGCAGSRLAALATPPAFDRCEIYL